MASGVDTYHSIPETQWPTATLQEADGKRSGYVPFYSRNSMANCHSSRSRWQAEWIRTILFPKLNGQLQLFKKPMASGVDLRTIPLTQIQRLKAYWHRTRSR